MLYFNPIQLRKYIYVSVSVLTVFRINSNLFLALEDLKAPITQTGVFSPQTAPKLDSVNSGIWFSVESDGVLEAGLDAAFLFFFSKSFSKLLRSSMADLRSFTLIPVLRTCLSPFDSQPTIAGRASTPNFFIVGSETSVTYVMEKNYLIRVRK